MNASQLATKMLAWEVKRRELDELEAEIKTAVLEIGKTQTVGNVKVTYSKGRRSFDYESGAMRHPDVYDDLIESYTERKIVVKTDWRGICKHVGAEDVPYTKGSPSASVKLVS